MWWPSLCWLAWSKKKDDTAVMPAAIWLVIKLVKLIPQVLCLWRNYPLVKIFGYLHFLQNLKISFSQLNSFFFYPSWAQKEMGHHGIEGFGRLKQDRQDKMASRRMHCRLSDIFLRRLLPQRTSSHDNSPACQMTHRRRTSTSMAYDGQAGHFWALHRANSKTILK